MANEPEDPHPVEQAIELLVFAPLGFALEARSLLPRFIERGRNQVAMARVVGKFAVRKGVDDLEAQVAERQDTVKGLLRLVGVVPAADELPHSSVASSNGDVGTTHDPAPATSPTAAVSPSEVHIGPPVEALAIPDYDSLSASQVIPRLDSLTDDELETVRRYELANRGRKTILGKVTQLQKV